MYLFKSTNAQYRPTFICGHVATVLAHPLQQAGGVLADVCEAGDDVVQVEVTEGGVVLTLPPHLEKKERREVIFSGFSLKNVLEQIHKPT